MLSSKFARRKRCLSGYKSRHTVLKEIWAPDQEPGPTASSLVSIIGLWELTMAGREVVERTLTPFQIFAGVALIYFCLCYSLATYGRQLENRMRYVH